MRNRGSKSCPPIPPALCYIKPRNELSVLVVVVVVVVDHECFFYRLSDFQMMTVNNSRERTKEEFEALFKAADLRFRLVDVHRTLGSPLAIIEVGFNAA